MRVGLALPQYDYSLPGENPLRFETIAAWARRAPRSSDSTRSGSPTTSSSTSRSTAAARSGSARTSRSPPSPPSRGVVSRARLGTLVLCEALRPASVLAKALATLDRICGGRLDVGLGAGWYEPDYEAIGMELPRPGVRVDRLREAVEVVRGLLGGEPLSFDGNYHRADGAVVDPPAVQVPHPPVFVGGKGDRVIRTAVDTRRRLEHLLGHGARPVPGAPRRGRPGLRGDRPRPGHVLALARALHPLRRGRGRPRPPLRRLQELSPPGILDRVTLDEWRVGRLVGTVEQVQEQVSAWAELGVETVIVGPGCVPFQMVALEDLDPIAEALS